VAGLLRDVAVQIDIFAIYCSAGSDQIYDCSRHRLSRIQE
jgi:hypothetical protein